tara:strand:- start:507 stop:776 length:270 start_codon:yes stop_codon:yes gene_type:complete
MKEKFKPYFDKEKFSQILSQCNKTDIVRKCEKFTSVSIGLSTIQHLSQKRSDNPQLITLALILFTINSIYKGNLTVNDFIKFYKTEPTS